MRLPAARLLGMTMIANIPNRSIHTVVMLRHGESLWNVENRFTGWCDVPLTANGEADAVDAGLLMGERGLQFDVAFTSNLERAWRTCALTLAAAGQSGVETIRSSLLNERHYGGKVTVVIPPRLMYSNRGHNFSFTRSPEGQPKVDRSFWRRKSDGVAPLVPHRATLFI